MRWTWKGTLAAVSLLVAAAATAQEGKSERPKQFRVAATDGPTGSVPQDGPRATALREFLKQIKLPPGFKIDLYALVPDARQMAVAPGSNRLFVGTRKTTVWAVADRNNDFVADEVKPFAPSVKFRLPNGVCWTRDGVLLVVELNRVLGFPAAAVASEDAEIVVNEVVPQGQLVPADEETPSHGARVCKVSDDGMLYIALGQPYNVQPASKVALYEKLGIGGIVRMNAHDASKREVYAVGIRNSVGLDFNPKDKSLWFTDNQTDRLGDDVPPGELNRATRVGQHFGYPYWNGTFKVAGSPVALDLKDMREPANAVFPQAEFPAHQAQLGMTFYTGRQFPAKYQGGIFVAAHGSWNRTKPTGALVNFVSLKPDGTADKVEVFAEGWLDSATGTYRGRPVDVAVLHDGSLLVSDDFAGAIYRISYRP